MRTQDQFWHQLEWWLIFHEKPAWLLALDDKYALSIIKPHPEEIADKVV